MLDVAIIGAGPYGLSLATYLRNAGVEFQVYGKIMDPWINNMPAGMLLKSHPWSSSLYDPGSSFTLREFCRGTGIEYHDSEMPLPLETFVAYGRAFQQHLVPNVDPTLLSALQKMRDHFRLTFEDGKTIAAKRVVLAVGVHPFKYAPPALEKLAPKFLSHSGDHGPLDGFVGKHVVILGAGASAIDLAGLLHEKGAAVSLVARTARLNFAAPPNARPRSALRRLARPLKPLIYPGSGIGAGWYLKFCADTPRLFHALPERWRLEAVRTTLGPLGHGAMKNRIEGQLQVMLNRDLVSADVKQGQVELRFTRQGSDERIKADHVIAATGYKIDLNRLGFLDPGLLSDIRSIENTPILSSDYETSVPGLHFIGPASANSFGPVARFVFGAVHPSRRLARYLAASRYRVPKPLAPAAALR